MTQFRGVPLKKSHNYTKLKVSHAYETQWNDWHVCWLNGMRNLQEEESFLLKPFGRNFGNIFT